MRAELLTVGGAGPPVAYVPGIDGTGELLLGTAARLERRFHLARLRYVEEDRPIGAATYRRLADTAVLALDAAGLDRAIVLAESFGGGIALTMALEHPDRVAALALVNTFAWYPSRASLALGALLLPMVPQTLLVTGRRTLASRALFRPRRDPHTEAAFRRVAPGFARRGYAQRLRLIPHLDLRRRLGDVAAPCALFAADSDRIVDSPRTMETLRAGLPDATLEVLPRAGHVVLPLAEEPWPERLEALAARAGFA